MTRPCLVVALTLLAACGDGSRDVQMICEASEPVRVRLDTPPQMQVARLGDYLFVSWYSSWVEAGDLAWYGQWFSVPSFEPASELIDLGGPAVNERPKWVEVDGHLEGYLLSDPEHRPLTERRMADILSWWTLTPPPAAQATYVTVPIDVPDECSGCIFASLYPTGSGWQGVLDTAVVGGRPIGGIAAQPRECFDASMYPPGEGFYTTLARLELFSRAELLSVVQPLEPHCPPETNTSERGAVAPWFVPLADGRVGVLFRTIDSGSARPMRYMVLDGDGDIVIPPVEVGAEFERFGRSGYQARGVRLGERILFKEDTRYNDVCSVLRRMKTDGRDPEDGPWQLPCESEPPVLRYKATLVSTWIEMERQGDYVGVLWSERTDPWGLDIRSTTTGWREGIHYALLDADGQLASEVIQITLPESTALAPVPRTEDFGPLKEDFRLALTGVPEGESGDAIAAWTDFRSDGPGIYASMIHCRALTPEERE